MQSLVSKIGDGGLIKHDIRRSPLLRKQFYKTKDLSKLSVIENTTNNSMSRFEDNDINSFMQFKNSIN
jgi:hypothetical protein